MALHIWLLENTGELVLDSLIKCLLVAAIAFVVIVTAKSGKPRVRGNATEYPPAWGTRIVLWITIGLWVLMAWAALDVGLSWLTFLFMWGPLLTVWRWPAPIVTDEASIRSTAPLRAVVSIYWTEIESVDPSMAGDSLIVKSRSGEKIKVPFTQIGAEELVKVIHDRSGFACGYEEPSLL